MSDLLSDDCLEQMRFRYATVADAELLARLNQQLIRDEGHRNSMSLAELTERMAEWLQGDYQGILVEAGTRTIAYALFRREPDFTYVRHLYVVPEQRRQGVGRQTLRWLWQQVGADSARLRIDVLVDNVAGRAFWNAVGFREYCITMESSAPFDDCLVPG